LWLRCRRPRSDHQRRLNSDSGFEPVAQIDEVRKKLGDDHRFFIDLDAREHRRRPRRQRVHE
jgi:hypothetical protein